MSTTCPEGSKRVKKLLDLFPEYRENLSQILEDLTSYVEENKQHLIDTQLEDLASCIYSTDGLQTACADIVTNLMKG